MRSAVKSDLVILNLLTIVLIVIINFSVPNVPRIVLGIPFLIFFPGYTLMAALFPRKEEIGSVTRVVLSFGTSIAVVGLIGLALNYTRWGITLESTLYPVATFIFITSAIAWFRRRRLPKHERFGVEFNITALGRHGTMWDRILTIMLAVSIVGAVGTLGYTMVNPKVGETFTEFYILGTSGKAIDYPSELKVGEEGKVIVGIINREHETVSYRVEVKIDGMGNNEVGPVVLGHDEKWEEAVSFTPDRVGDSQKVEFLLYKNGGSEPCLKPLHLWVDVRKQLP